MTIPLILSLRDPALCHALVAEYRVPLHDLDSDDPEKREIARQRLHAALFTLGASVTGASPQAFAKRGRTAIQRKAKHNDAQRRAALERAVKQLDDDHKPLRRSALRDRANEILRNSGAPDFVLFYESNRDGSIVGADFKRCAKAAGLTRRRPRKPR